jgi:hypothetical protein
MKALAFILTLVAIVALATCVSDARKPELLAHVDLTKQSLIITNGNDKPWRWANVMLNDAFDGPRTTVKLVEPGARVEIALTQFVGRLNKQRFNPEFQKVELVLIDTADFQLGSFQIRRR